MVTILDQKKHDETMHRVLIDIYTDPELAINLIFKGGTACYLFYQLPRFSVDLDFDLLQPEKKELVFNKIQKIAARYGKITDAWIKRNTILVELSYRVPDRNLKIEISARTHEKITYDQKNLLGLSILVMSQDAMCANKLLAITERKKIVNRDYFDAYFFPKNGWPLDDEIIETKGERTVPEQLNKILDQIEKTESPNILFGLGELINEKQKTWVKNNLLKELKIYLNLYLRKYSFEDKPL